MGTTGKAKVLYMEPSTFGYNGLKQQRQNNYDNFLRSNIDNEQDNRNFNNENGLDHLPFRTYQMTAPVTYPYTGTLTGGDDDSLQNTQTQPTVIRVQPGEPKMTPLRWNNPHASEIEVNLWIMCSNPPTIVRVKKPTCSGEGNQNNIIRWAIPSDFNEVGWSACPSTACFSGCKKPGDCVLQIYAHSVETRQYSTSVPIIVEGAKLTGAQTMPYAARAADYAESNLYAWTTQFDHRAMVQGTAVGSSQQRGTGSGGNAVSLNDVQVCASSKRGGLNEAGDVVDQVVLSATAQALNSPETHLYLCLITDAQKASAALVDKVVYEVSNQGSNTVIFTKTENYAPYEAVSSNDFGGGNAIKQVKATLTGYDGTTRTINVLLNLQGNGGRWRFRRHLQAVCPGGLPEPPNDPWLDLAKLKRETCLPANDPAANYAVTKIQRAILYSDVANHAFQNSNYSPYSGQQHDEISRNLQAAAVIHMTTGNRGELGKNSIPNDVKARLNQLNNKVNNLYQAYEKVANKVIDQLSKSAAGRSGANQMEGVQPLGDTFRGLEKGATSTKRLKTTTYVPSFSTANYNLNTIKNTISKNAGRNNQFADLLSDPKPNTGIQYIEIYQATMNKMLADFKAAESLGITYLPAVRQETCSSITDQALKTKSAPTQNALQEGLACCSTSLNDHGALACGSTLASPTNFRKRNANGRADGGRYASQVFTRQRHMSQYACPAACMDLSRSDINQGTTVMKALSKSSAGTCVTFLAGADGCVTNAPLNNNGATGCQGCVGIFTNVAPKIFTGTMGPTNPLAPGGAALSRLIRSSQAAVNVQPEPLSQVSNGAIKDPLTADNTAICWSESSFSCPNGATQAGFEQDVKNNNCDEVESTKIDKMCDDGPCDNDPESLVCRRAKANCDVDPDSGMKCMPGNENNPCAGCVRQLPLPTASPIASAANGITIAFIPLLLAFFM